MPAAPAGAASAAVPSDATSRFSVLGSGNSTGVPWLHCVLNDGSRCSVCANCIAHPTSRNIRSNVSALVSHGGRHILIDCGKTFRDVVLRVLPALGVTTLDAVLLTHAHADAIGGLDDLRDVSPRARLPVYASEPTFRRCTAAFDYLVREGAPVREPAGTSSAAQTQAAPSFPRAAHDDSAPPATFIAQLDWRIIRPFEPFEVAGLIVTPLPVEHGEPGPMLGFEFRHTVGATGSGSGVGAAESTSDAASAGARIVYLSDIAALPLDTRGFLTRGPAIDLLVLDALAYDPYPTHFSVGQAVACALDLAARSTLLVGMGHRVDYYTEQPRLAAFAAARGADISLAYDGWTRALRLHSPATRADVAAELRAAHVAAQQDWLLGHPALASTAALAVVAAESSAPPESPAARPDGADGFVIAKTPPIAVDVLPCRSSPLDVEFDAAAERAGANFAGWVAPSQLPTFAPAAAPKSAPLLPAIPPPPLGSLRLVPVWPLSKHGRPPAVSYLDKVHPDFERS